MARCTARLRLRKADSCSGPGPVSGTTLWKCPARGRPPTFVLNPKVSEAGAHRPLEISRATAADHACVRAARFPHSHSAHRRLINTENQGVS